MGCLAAAPAQAETHAALFAGPRLDTSARLNARVDTEGEGLSHESEFEDPCGAVVDDQGYLYVAAWNENLIKIFDPAGTLVTEFTPSANIEHPCGLAVDSLGDVYVTGWGTDVVKYKPSTGLPATSATVYAPDTAINGTGTLVSGGATAVAVDPSNDDVYVAEGSHVSSYRSDGTLISATIGESVPAASFYGVDVYGANGNVYVTDTSSGIAYILDPDATQEIVAEIDGSESTAGEFAEFLYPYLAVDQSNGHVYVSDIHGHGVVDEFDQAGAFVEQLPGSFQDAEPSDIAVDNSGGPNDGVVYVTSGFSGGSVLAVGETHAYHFEYSADGGGSWQSLPQESYTVLAPGQVVSQELTGLQPGATYRYRIVIETISGSFESDEATFTTRTAAELAEPTGCANADIRSFQHASYLGDCRALELVNSPNKGNQNVQTSVPQLGTTPITTDGNKALWTLLGGSPGGTSGSESSFLAQRTEGGWVSSSLVPPGEQQVGGAESSYLMQVANPSLSAFAFLTKSTGVGSVIRGLSLVRTDQNQNQELLADFPNAETAFTVGVGMDIADDGSQLFYVNPETEQLESAAGGTKQVVNVLQDGKPSECGLEGAASFSGTGNSAGGAAPNWHPGYHRFGDDGSRVFFEAKPNGDCTAPWGLYQRNRETATTTLIDPGSFSDSEAIRATPSGRGIYFTTMSKLDPADINFGRDVYRWDEESGESTCLTCSVASADVEPGVMVSDDFSHLYFQSQRQLIPHQGTKGDSNIYVLSQGGLRFVADPGRVAANLLAVGVSNSSQPPELSRDGNTLVLRLPAAPTLTDDSISVACPLGQCWQVYRYEDSNGSLECLSCSRRGPTMGIVDSQAQISTGARYFGASGDGSTAAFVTGAPLVPADVNNDIDVYEWRNGAVHLLTDGLLAQPESSQGVPAVRAVDFSGRNIFFSAVDPERTGFERDGLANLYDARIEGGFSPPTPPQHCSEESCQGPLGEAPPVAPIGSEGVIGRGNRQAAPKRKRCAGKHGKARRRCRGRHRRHRAIHHGKGGGKRKGNRGNGHKRQEGRR